MALLRRVCRVLWRGECPWHVIGFSVNGNAGQRKPSGTIPEARWSGRMDSFKSTAIPSSCWGLSESPNWRGTQPSSRKNGMSAGRVVTSHGRPRSVSEVLASAESVPLAPPRWLPQPRGRRDVLLRPLSF